MNGEKIKGKSSVYKTLMQSPGSFAFAQAVNIVQGRLKSEGAADPENAVRYLVNPNLSFPPSDTESIRFEHGPDGPKAFMTMNLMGLHGAGSPLPAYFTEHVAIHQDDPDALREFFDVFNHFLVTSLYGAWKKYRYYTQYETGARDKLSRRFFGFIGMGYEEIKEAGNIQWEKLLPYMGLISFKGDAAGSLESTLRHYFNHDKVSILPCIFRMVDIHPDQQCRLGEANSSLPGSMVLGESVPDQTGKFRIRLADLGWKQFNSFLPDCPIFLELVALVKTILRSKLQFDVELRLRPEEIQPFEIGEASVVRLGWSTWLGESGDGIVVLEPNRAL